MFYIHKVHVKYISNFHKLFFFTNGWTELKISLIVLIRVFFKYHVSTHVFAGEVEKMLEKENVTLGQVEGNTAYCV